MRNPRRRWRRQSIASVRQEAGRASQSNECVNGTSGCPGADADTSTLPCTACFLGGDT